MSGTVEEAKGWQPRSTVKYCLTGLIAGTPVGASTTDVRNAAVQAFTSWNSFNQTNNSRVRFVESCDNPQITFSVGRTQVNNIDVAASNAMNQSLVHRRSDIVRSSHITIDLKGEGTPSAGTCFSGAPCEFFDPSWDNFYPALRSTVAHEIGHSMGLDDVPLILMVQGHSIMNGGYVANDCYKASPGATCISMAPLGPGPCEIGAINTRYPIGGIGTTGGGGSSGGACERFNPNLDTCFAICTGQQSHYTPDGCGGTQGDLCAAIYPEVFPDGIVECSSSTRLLSTGPLLSTGAWPLNVVSIVVDSNAIGIKASGGQFLGAVNGGGSSVEAVATSQGSWETLTLADLNGGTLVDGDPISLQTPSGHYLQAVGGGGGALLATASAVGSWETFRVINLEKAGDEILSTDRIALRTSNGHYVVAEGGGGQIVNANRGAIGSWETFTIVRGGTSGGGSGPGPGGGGSDVISSGQALYAGQSVWSASGQYELKYQHDGNLVLYSDGTAVWSSNTAGASAGMATMQSDGNFVIYDASGTPLQHSATWGHNGAHLKVQDDGNVVIYSTSGTPLWDRYSSGW